MKGNSGFRLSRIQAEGWKAAHSLPELGHEHFDAAKIDALNPYSTDTERRRWAKGFTSALGAERG